MRELTMQQAAERGISKWAIKADDYFFELASGEVVSIDKPAIKSTLWYGEEQPDPADGGEGLEGAFRAYNPHNLRSPATDWFAWRRGLDETGCACAPTGSATPRTS